MLEKRQVPKTKKPQCGHTRASGNVINFEVNHMANHSAIAEKHNQPQPDLYDLSMAAYDSATLAHSQLADLAAMFFSIRRESAPDSQAFRLASVGHYLAEDWANTLDCQNEEFRTVMGSAA